MRLSELIGSEVRDGNDRLLGHVVDVRVESQARGSSSRGSSSRDSSSQARRFQITGVLVGRRPDLKAARPDQRGPLLFALLERRRVRRRRFVPWTQVQSAQVRPVGAGPVRPARIADGPTDAGLIHDGRSRCKSCSFSFLKSLWSFLCSFMLT